MREEHGGGCCKGGSADDRTGRGSAGGGKEHAAWEVAALPGGKGEYAAGDRSPVEREAVAAHRPGDL